MSNLFDEDNLRLDFSNCPLIRPVERFDCKQGNPSGLLPVDFVAETAECLYFIEVKDFQNPAATVERWKADLELLATSVEDKKDRKDRCSKRVRRCEDANCCRVNDCCRNGMQPEFPVKMAQKLKDSLLRRYAQGESLNKSVVFLLLINMNALTPRERTVLYDKIRGHIPTGLKNSQFSAFNSVTFELVNANQIKTYGIICTTIN